MKKLTIIFLSMLLVLSIGQAAFANAEVGLKLGYRRNQIQYENLGTLYGESISSFDLGFYGNYKFINNLSIAADVNVMFGSSIRYNDNFTAKVTMLNGSLFAKYDIFKLDIADLGLQAGIMDDYLYYHGGLNVNLFFVALGVYADVQIAPKINLYGELKLPVFSYFISNDKITERIFKPYTGLFKTFLYDASVGFTYDITPDIILGIEGNIYNACVFGIYNQSYRNEPWSDSPKTFSFSIGAKLGYKF